MIALYFIVPYQTIKENSHIKDSFKKGLLYIYQTNYIYYPISFMFFLSFVIMPVITLLPVYVKKMGGDSQNLGLLISSLGIGAALSGFEMASKIKAKNYVNMVNNFSVLYGLSLILLSLNKYYFLSYFLLFVAGISTSRQAVGLNTIIQTLVKDEMRGRVISIYSLSFMGLAPVGNLLWGYLADKIGISKVFSLCGLWVLIVNLWFYLNMKKVRKVVKNKENFNESFFEIL